MKKIEEIKKIFWEMNEVSFTKEETTEEKTIIHLTWTEHKTITHTKLHIKINHKTAQEMADKYNFSNSQRELRIMILIKLYSQKVKLDNRKKPGIYS